jgi:hypothetical protein
MTAHATRHEQNSTAARGTPLLWWAPRLLLVAMGALLGAELGIWVSEPGELDRIAHSLGIGSHPGVGSSSATAPVEASTHAQDDAWHQTPEPKVAIPTVDVSVLPHASEGSSASHASSSSSHRGPRTTTRSARARAAAKQDQDPFAGKGETVASPAALDPATLSTALSDALGE